MTDRVLRHAEILAYRAACWLCDVAQALHRLRGKRSAAESRHWN